MAARLFTQQRFQQNLKMDYFGSPLGSAVEMKRRKGSNILRANVREQSVAPIDADQRGA